MQPDDYLDHAATSWPKPGAVVDAVTRWYTEFGVSADRGDSNRTEAVRREVQRTRDRLGAKVGTTGDRVAFTSGATESLHLCFSSLLRDGDRVVTTQIEHSSVARPLRAGGYDLAIVPCDDTGRVDPDELAREVAKAPTRLLVVNHASNVTGAVQDLGPAFAAARSRATLSILDASQTLGQVPVPDLGGDDGPDLLVASAHKSLLGPPGLGVLASAAAFDETIEPPKPGGTGSSIALDEHPRHWPALFESGTPNTPAILGLGAALEWTSTTGIRNDEATLAELDRFGSELVAACPGARVIRPTGMRIPVLSFTLPHLDPAEAGMLASGHGFHLRTGFHCAPWIHRALGTEASGTIRVSLGPLQTGRRLSELVNALAR